MQLCQVCNYADKYEGVDLTAEVEGLNREGTYSEYLDIHAGAMFPDARVSVDVCEYDTRKNIRERKMFSIQKMNLLLPGKLKFRRQDFIKYILSI